MALNSVLNHPIDLVWGTREDDYAHTHALMYFTNFGYWRQQFPRPRSEILAESTAILARSLLFEDYDLAAEVLMAWPFTGAAWTPAATFGFTVLSQLEDSVGFLPSGTGVPERFDELTGADRTRYALAAAYHTAYVMGMLCALLLRPDKAPPREIVGAAWPTKLVEELLSMLPDKDGPWLRTFRNLQAREQQALGPFLLDMGLVSRARNSDFAAVANLLQLALTHGYANTPLCAQSAELLSRIAVCAETQSKVSVGIQS
jgi:hypothetical protein